MIKIVGVRFRSAGKVYYFDPKDYTIRPGDHVIVETARGVEYGTVTSKVQEVPDEKVVQPLKPVLRVAGEEDNRRMAEARIREKEALFICKEKVRRHNLDMKLIDAEYTFDGTKLLFYFTADGRVDFRELVKDLASVFRTRIELRQIGVRDETKILGGVGICGRQLCCHTFLSEFAPVSIRMAKEQNLSLNPVKISGVCGRLMCCLKNEEETYEYLNSQLPGMGDTVMTPTGEKGVVTGINVLRQRVKVLFQEGEDRQIEEFPISELEYKPRKKKEKGGSGQEKNGKGKNKKDKEGGSEKAERKGREEGDASEEGSEQASGKRKERRRRRDKAEREEQAGQNGSASFDEENGLQARENGEGSGKQERRQKGNREEKRRDSQRDPEAAGERRESRRERRRRQREAAAGAETGTDNEKKGASADPASEAKESRKTDGKPSVDVETTAAESSLASAGEKTEKQEENRPAAAGEAAAADDLEKGSTGAPEA